MYKKSVIKIRINIDQAKINVYSSYLHIIGNLERKFIIHSVKKSTNKQ